MLHDSHLRHFLNVWKQAHAAAVVLPETVDPAYASLDTLLRHVIGGAGWYLTWVCEKLTLPDPGIDAAPEAEALSKDPERYMDHVLERWRQGLLEVRDDQMERPEYPSPWQTRYSIDAMLEHAVMHPIRHAFQLEELMGKR